MSAGPVDFAATAHLRNRIGSLGQPYYLARFQVWLRSVEYTAGLGFIQFSAYLDATDVDDHAIDIIEHVVWEFEHLGVHG